jgi:hypothetical protein
MPASAGKWYVITTDAPGPQRQGAAVTWRSRRWNTGQSAACLEDRHEKTGFRRFVL